GVAKADLFDRIAKCLGPARSGMSERFGVRPDSSMRRRIEHKSHRHSQSLRSYWGNRRTLLLQEGRQHADIYDVYAIEITAIGERPVNSRDCPCCSMAVDRWNFIASPGQRIIGLIRRKRFPDACVDRLRISSLRRIDGIS